MRTTRRTGGDNGYKSPEDYASEGRGYEPNQSVTDQLRAQRDDTDYRGQGENDADGNNAKPNEKGIDKKDSDKKKETRLSTAAAKMS